MRVDDVTSPVKGISPCNLCVQGVAILLSFISYVWILRTIQNRFRANKDRECPTVLELYANENGEVNEGLTTREIFSSILLLKKTNLKDGDSSGIPRVTLSSSFHSSSLLLSRSYGFTPRLYVSLVLLLPIYYPHSRALHTDRSRIYDRGARHCVVMMALRRNNGQCRRD